MHNPYPRFSFGFRFNLMDDASQNVSFDVVSVAIIWKSIGVEWYFGKFNLRLVWQMFFNYVDSDTGCEIQMGFVKKFDETAKNGDKHRKCLEMAFETHLIQFSTVKTWSSPFDGAKSAVERLCVFRSDCEHQMFDIIIPLDFCFSLRFLPFLPDSLFPVMLLTFVRCGPHGNVIV